MERPIHLMLHRTSRRMSLHMPGGQGCAPFGRISPYRLDTTEMEATDDLYRPTGAIARAQELAAKSAGAAGTLMLCGGSTAGIHAMLLYAVKRGEEVILPRNAHISCIHLCAMAGLIPVFVAPSYTPAGRPYSTLADYARAMDEHPQAKAALVVRPDYYGALIDLRGIAQKARAHGMLMLCDEAHGAHFNWDKDAESALACGAELVVQSAHKTLPALTAGAWLHGTVGVDFARLLRMLRMVQTSSPSFVTFLSLDDARAWMDRHGAAACARLRKAMAAFHEKAVALGYADAQDEGGMAYDPLRLVLYAPQGGFVLGQALAAHGLDVELCDGKRIACILSLMDGEKRLKRLLKALKRIGRPARGEATMPSLPPDGLPKRLLPLCEAAFAPSVPVPLAQTVGRISACQIGLYPPGIALLTAGEQVTPEIMHYLSQIGTTHLFGLNDDGTMNCVQ